MNYVVDIVVVALLARVCGKGRNPGIDPLGGQNWSRWREVLGGSSGAFYLKAPVAERLSFRGCPTSTGGAAGKRSGGADHGELAAAGVEGRTGFDGPAGVHGLPALSISGMGTLIDRLTGTGTNIVETARNLVAQRIAYVLLFIILFFRDSACDDDFVHVHGWA